MNGGDEAGGQNARSALDRLSQGVEAFRTQVFPGRREQFGLLARGQNPEVLFVTCADSRIVPEMITQTGPGELFVCRNIGNIVPGYGAMMGGVSAVIEYAVVALKVRHIIVCGHSDCGAMKGLITCDDPTAPAAPEMPAVENWLGNAHAARSIVEATRPDLTGPAKVQALVEQNVLVQLQHLRTYPAVAARIAAGTLDLHGWVYDIESGGVQAHDEAAAGFAPLSAGAVQAVADGEPAAA